MRIIVVIILIGLLMFLVAKKNTAPSVQTTASMTTAERLSRQYPDDTIEVRTVEVVR